jgi:hypothetical protein
VALDESGRPSFNALQNSASSERELVYYVYDVMIIAGKDVMSEPFDKRRILLEKKILPKLKEPVRYSSTLNAKLADLVESVKASAFEGLVAKRADSRYEPGIRSGAWQKMRINQGQEFVIGGYTGCVFRAKSSSHSDRKSSTIPGASQPVIPTPKHPAFRREAIQFCGHVGTADEMPESIVKGR